MKEISIKELKELEVDILDYFVDICNKNGLNYFLGFGTLLGAVRHKGFIPWDDDIDVMMPRADYQKLIEVFPEHEYYKLIYYGSISNYPVAFGTINDTRTVKPERNIRNKCNGIKCVNIDIFPLDNVPDDWYQKSNYYDEIEKMGKKVFGITYKFGKSNGFVKTIKKNIGIAIFRLSEVFGLSSVDSVIGKMDFIAKKYMKEETKTCGLTCFHMYGEKQCMLKKDIFPASHVEFEGRVYSAPYNTDAILTKIYGDYMKLPPKEKRKTHHVSTCYWR